MKVSGFTFVRNALIYDFPVKESILSILPLCDEVVVAVGKSEDDTLELIRSINSDKIKIIETIWDDSLREGGKVLAVETNKALDAISPDSDWAFYIQADEVFHEADISKIKAGMEKYLNNTKVEGLLFDHLNFMGSYNYVADSHKWIKKEIRVIRNDKKIRSWKDAMSFRKNGKKLNVKYVDACIYHYGWVKSPFVQKQKRIAFDKLWHSDDWIKTNHNEDTKFDYQLCSSLVVFQGTHPSVMAERISNADWKFEYNASSPLPGSIRIKLLDLIRKKTGVNIGEFKNYRLI